MKRSAATELNQDNWDNEEEPEEKGIFKKASKEDLSKRVIRTGKRRLGTQTQGADKPAFSGFSGFGVQNKSSAPVFSFLSNNSNSNKSEENNKKEEKNNDKSDEYLAKLKCLNESVLDWIKSQMEKNPLCILTPIFTDYEKHLKEIRGVKEEVAPKSDFGSFKFTPTGTTAGTTYEIGSQKTDESKTSLFDTKKQKTTNSFSFPVPSTTNPLFSSSDNKSLFSFGNPSDKTSQESSKPVFSFLGGSTSEPQPSKAEEKKEDDDDEVQGEKYDLVPVVENDALFSQRVKLFVKKDNNYADKGVGMLYIKKVNDKYQTIVRADTNLGNILLNIILNEDIPSERVGKNNVTLICVPNTDCKPPPVPVLLRVKTEAEADKLLETINKYKKKDDSSD